MASIRDTLTKLLASDKPEPGTPLANYIGQYPFQQGEAPLEAPMFSPDDLIGTGIGKATLAGGAKLAPLLMGMVKNPKTETMLYHVTSAENLPKSLAKGLLENTPKVNDELQQPFIGYLNKDGSHEMYNHEAAKSADYHHSHLMENPDNYFNDDALTFVRMGGENVFTIKGNSVLDPYEKQSSKQIGTLAKKLIDQGADPLAPFHVEDLALPKIEAPYQGKQIGALQDWVKYSK